MKTWLGSGVFAAVVLAGACAQALTISDAKLVMDPSGHAPLSGLLTFTTDAPATATLVIESAGRETMTHEFTGKAGTAHSLMVLGMVANAKHRVHAEVKDAGGGSAKTQAFEVQTAPLPDNFPPLTVTTARPRRMEPGFTIVPFFRWPPGAEPDRNYGLMVAVNAQGEVVWVYKTDHTANDPVMLVNGNMAYQYERSGVMYEIDMLGNIVRRWHSTGIPKDGIPADSIPVETDTFHHNFDQKPDGNFLILSTEVRKFDAYPSSESTVPSPTAPSEVIGDVILEVEPTGKIVRQAKLFDLVDPMRIGYDSLGTFFYAQVYAKVLKAPAKDWSHTNSVFYDAKTDNLVLSSRHLDFVYKLDLKTGKLKWILGNHDGWSEREQPLLLKPIGDNFKWQYHQHAAKVTPQGTILLFDNGNFRARPGQERQPADQNYSRAVEFKVDEAAMTVEQVWSYGEDAADRFHSPFICDVDWLTTTGNVLITDGGRIKDKDGKPSVNLFAGHHWSRIVEVTHEQPAAKVWELVIDDPRVGWAVFRSERVASLYR